MLAQDLSTYLLPIPAYLFIALAVFTVRAWRRRQQPLGKWRFGILCALLIWSYLFSTPGFGNVWIRHLEHQYPRVEEVERDPQALILVLSSGYQVKQDGRWDERLDGPGWERTWAGVELWRKLGGKLLFVGDPALDRVHSTAGKMAEVARALAVPESAIAVEGKSINTYQNFTFSQAALQAAAGHVWVVTSAIHMPRAMAIARRLGLAVRPYPCDFHSMEPQHWYVWLPNSGGPEMFADALHETIGRIWYIRKGWASP